jgi:uncharacterized integral membrane protein
MKPWKLIIFLVILAVFVLFAGFNISHTSTISFGFYKFEDIPIFVSLFIAFILGAFVMLPFVIFSGRKKRVPPQKEKKPKSPETLTGKNEKEQTEPQEKNSSQ